MEGQVDSGQLAGRIQQRGRRPAVRHVPSVPAGAHGAVVRPDGTDRKSPSPNTTGSISSRRSRRRRRARPALRRKRQVRGFVEFTPALSGQMFLFVNDAIAARSVAEDAVQQQPRHRERDGRRNRARPGRGGAGAAAITRTGRQREMTLCVQVRGLTKNCSCRLCSPRIVCPPRGTNGSLRTIDIVDSSARHLRDHDGRRRRAGGAAAARRRAVCAAAGTPLSRLRVCGAGRRERRLRRRGRRRAGPTFSITRAI